MFQENETKNRVCQWRLETCYYRVRRSHGLSYNVNPCNHARHTWNTPVHTFQMSSWKHDEACDFTWRDTNVFLSRRLPPMQRHNAWPASDQHRRIHKCRPFSSAAPAQRGSAIHASATYDTIFSIIAHFTNMSKFTITGMTIIASLLDEEQDNRKRKEIWN